MTSFTCLYYNFLYCHRTVMLPRQPDWKSVSFCFKQDQSSLFEPLIFHWCRVDHKLDSDHIYFGGSSSAHFYCSCRRLVKLIFGGMWARIDSVSPLTSNAAARRCILFQLAALFEQRATQRKIRPLPGLARHANAVYRGVGGASSIIVHAPSWTHWRGEGQYFFLGSNRRDSFKLIVYN